MFRLNETISIKKLHHFETSRQNVHNNYTKSNEHNVNHVTGVGVFLEAEIQ